MHTNSEPIFDGSSVVTNCIFNENEYDSKKIVNVIRRYHELRSLTELTAAQYENIGGSSHTDGKGDIMCILADIDQGVAILSARQTDIVRLLKMGYLIKEISKILDIRQVTVNFHIRQAALRLAAHLNAAKVKEG